MKTIKEINREIKEKAEVIQCASESEKKRLKSQIELLRQYKYYLESNPSQEYLQNEIKELERKISVLSGRYGSWLQANAGKHSNSLQAFRTEMEIPRLERQKKTLKMLLSAAEEN